MITIIKKITKALLCMRVHKKVSRFCMRTFVMFLMLVMVSSAVFGPNFIFKNETAQAVFNKQINYQGKLTNTSNVAVADGLYHMTFRLYTSPTAATTTNLWEEDRSTAAGDRVTVTNGLFSVMLGSSTPLTSVDFNQTLYLGVEIGGSGGSSAFDGEMTPRKKLGAVPAAFVADTVDNISSEQFLRSDTSNATSTATSWLSFVQNGAGKIAEFFGPSSVSVLSILGSGNVGIGTTTPYAKLSVVGQVVASYFTATTSTASTFPYASSTATSVSGTGYFGTASTTNLTVSGISGCSGSSALNTSASGVVSCGAITGFSTFSYPFTAATNYGVNTSATSTPIWAQAGIFASSTSHFANLDVVNSTTTSSAYFPGSGVWNALGRLGVGTTSPDSYLSVLGAGANGGMFLRSGYALGTLYYGAQAQAGEVGEGSTGLGVYDDNDGSIYGVYSSDGNAYNYFAGTTTIGTISNSAKLTVVGGDYTVEIADYADTRGVHASDGSLNTGSLADTGAGAGVSGTGATYGVLGTNSSSVGTAVFALQNIASGYAFQSAGGKNYFAGNVGIGTSSPYAPLSVMGQTVSSYFTATTSTASTFPYASSTATSVSGTGYFGTASTTNLTVSGISGCSGSSALNTSASGVVSCGAITGFSTFSYPFTAATNYGVNTSATSTPIWAQAGIFASSTSHFVYASTTALTVAGSSFFGDGTGIWGSDGKVGIGTTSPWAQLSINPNGLTGPAFVIGSSTATSFIVTNGGWVGIGTTTPEYALHVVAATTTDSAPLDVLTVEAIRTGGPGVGFGPSILFKDAAVTADYMARIASVYESGPGGSKQGSLVFAVAHNGGADASAIIERMRISHDGYVGIGTTTPFALLAVSATPYTAGTNNTLSPNLFLVASSTLTSTTTHFIVTAGGNSGFGTSSPWAHLSVNPNAIGTAPAFVIGSSTKTDFLVANSGRVGVASTSPWAQLSINPHNIGTAPAFAIGSSTRTNFIVTNIGNVGVGTSSPSGTFAAQGNQMGFNGVPTAGQIFLTGGSGVLSGIGLAGSDGGAVVITGGIGGDDGAGADLNGGAISITGGTTGGLGGGTGGNVDINPGAATGGTVGNILLASTNLGKVGIGTTSPYAKLSVVGQVVASYFTATTSTASTFPYASSTATSVSGTGYFGTASTTNLTVSGISGCSGSSALNTSASGVVSCGAITGFSTFSYPFTAATNYGVNTSATSTPIWAQAGIFASSTSHFANLDVVNSTTTSSAYFPGSGVWNASGNVGVGTTSPWATLSVVGGTADSVPTFVLATTTGKTPLFYVTSTTTGNLDWARVAIGTTTNSGNAGLRDQFVVAGRIYSTWKYLACDMLGSDKVVTAARGSGTFCGSFALDSNASMDGGFTFISDANPSYLRMRAGVTTSALVGEAEVVRTGTRAIAPENNPVMEVSVRTPTIVDGTGSTSAYYIGFTSHVIQTTVYHIDPSDGVYFAATSTNTWQAVTRVGNVDTVVDTGVATSTTNFKKMRIELTPTLATFLIDNAVVGNIGTTIPTGVNLSLVLSVAVTNAPTTPARDLDISLIRLWVDDPPGGEVIESQNNFATIMGAPPEYDAITGGNISTSYLVGDPSDYVEGELVSIDESGGMKVKKSDKKYDNLVLGVVAGSTYSSAQILGNENESTIRVAMNGRANVLVNNENGEIKVGDLITTSSTAGVGMKALGSGYVLGRALGALPVGQATSTIMVELNPHDYSGNTIHTDDEGNVGVGTSTPSSKLDVMGDVSAYGFGIKSRSSLMNSIVTLGQENYDSYLNKIKDINISTYKYKGDESGAIRIGIISEDAPAEILSVNGDSVDTHKLAVFTLGGVKALNHKFESLEVRVTNLENLSLGLASSTASTTNSGTLPTTFMDSIMSHLGNLGANISDGFAGFKKLITETLTVGSSEKPTGITIYDDKNGEPHCVKVSNGKIKTEAGECGAGDVIVPDVEVLPTTNPMVDLIQDSLPENIESETPVDDSASEDVPSEDSTPAEPTDEALDDPPAEQLPEPPPVE